MIALTLSAVLLLSMKHSGHVLRVSFDAFALHSHHISFVSYFSLQAEVTVSVAIMSDVEYLSSYKMSKATFTIDFTNRQ